VLAADRLLPPVGLQDVVVGVEAERAIDLLAIQRVRGPRHSPEWRSRRATARERLGRGALAQIPNSDHAGPAVGTPPVVLGRVPRRAVRAGATTVGTSAALGMFHPMLGAAIVGIEIVVVLTIIATALFGSQALSERAFRLLRWFGNRPQLQFQLQFTCVQHRPPRYT